MPLTNFLTEHLSSKLQIQSWRRNGFSMPAPWTVKMAVLSRHAIADAPWIETGTFLGKTTEFLAKSSPQVVSLEPDNELFVRAAKSLQKLSNVQLINKTSEEGLIEALRTIKAGSSVNFWLDGHYSSGTTYKGTMDSPIQFELDSVSGALASGQLSSARVFIDDARLFQTEHKEIPDDTLRPGYPGISSLTNWSNSVNGRWSIEHDIFIIEVPPPKPNIH